MSGAEPFIIMQVVAAAAGTAVTMYGKKEAEKQRQYASEQEARAMDREAKAQRAASQQQAEREREKAAILIGRQRAVAAAGGGNIEGSVLEILGNTASKGELNSDIALWEGEEKGRKLENSAILKRQGSAAAHQAYKINQTSTLISGVNTAMSIYGKGTGGKGTSGDLYYGSKDDGWKTSVRYG
ncbi:MAG: hypothetical protein KDI55_00400 [Anaerolineae bacterium]|nr:hypothetical protein [Anaerolineae bacterium]